MEGSKKRKNKALAFFSGRKGKQRIFISGMLIWSIIHFAIFWLYVNIDAIFLAFRNDARGEWTFDNFKWLIKMFVEPEIILDMNMAVRNTLILFFWNMCVELPIAVVLAYVFFKKLPGNKIFTICLYLPSIISAAVMVAVYKSFLGSEGPFAQILGQSWVYPITNPETSMISMLVYNLWTGYGLNIILFRSAMGRIPPEIFESAAMDGITMFEELTKMILPLIWPTLSTMMLISISGVFGASGPVLLFVGEWDAHDAGLMTVGHAMYLQYKVSGMVERAAAMGLFFTVISLPIVCLSRWLLTKVEGEYEY